ncbi:MAG TPA: UvrD-helicase domain-containing protein, partial [Solirubrobacterales bacterium]|nr:UvrD-helicase domain-containing protein [Solirubrobacterales bacterium]
MSDATPTEPAPPEPVIERSPTPEQRAAIEARGRDVLLEAGAGSGKTGVMVERYARLVVDEGVSPDAVLAFTFTDKAAAELRARVRAELSRRAAGSDAKAVRAAALLTTIGGAWITTIHGFCNRVLAAHPVAAGVDPGFRVLDQPEAERAAREAFDTALAEFLAGGEPAREETVAAYDLEGLRGVIVAIHDELRSRGVAEPSLPDPPTSDPAEALAATIETAGECLEELKESDPKREALEEALARLTMPGPDPTLAELEALRPGGTAKALAPFRDALEAAIARTAEAGEGGVAYRHLADLLRLYTAAFEAAKARRAGIDFEDLQILAARLLERAEIGQAYRGRFSHLLVDEFQDTNRLQLRLIEALQGPKTQLVVVGDELQSIYSFRHADLDVFRRRRAQIDADPGAELMQLSGNFRSRPEVIAAVNLFGAALLGPAYRPLRVGAPPADPAPRGRGPAVELHLTARDGW